MSVPPQCHYAKAPIFIVFAKGIYILADPQRAIRSRFVLQHSHLEKPYCCDFSHGPDSPAHFLPCWRSSWGTPNSFPVVVYHDIFCWSMSYWLVSEGSENRIIRPHHDEYFAWDDAVTSMAPCRWARSQQPRERRNVDHRFHGSEYSFYPYETMCQCRCWGKENLDSIKVPLRTGYVRRGMPIGCRLPILHGPKFLSTSDFIHCAGSNHLHEKIGWNSIEKRTAICFRGTGEVWRK